MKKTRSKLQGETALNSTNSSLNRKVIETLVGGNADRAVVIADMLADKRANDNQKTDLWEKIRAGELALSVDQLAGILRALEESGLDKDIDPEKAGLIFEKDSSPMSQLTFYEALEKGLYDAEKARRKLTEIYEESKKEKGFLKNRFSTFAAENPVEKIMNDLSAFDKYCRKNGITFDDIKNDLVQGEKPKTAWQKVKDFKFLLAAVGGAAAGFAGINADALPVANQIPGLFFHVLPYFAVPFIGLNVFKSFSQRRLRDDAATLGRFAGLMGLGVMIGFGVTSLMSGHLGSLDVGQAAEQAKEATKLLDGGAILSFMDAGLAKFDTLLKSASPGQILLPVIAGALGLSFAYKAAKKRVNEAGQKLSDKFNRAVVSSSERLHRWTDTFDKGFMGFINYTGVPAISLLLASTMSQGGFEKFSQYSGYYATVGLALTGCAVALTSAAYAYGCRRKEFKEIGHVFQKAFSLSSSSGTMPFTKEALRRNGVREEIREAVAPLGATFNMMGTAQYLGVTAVCTAMMLGMDPGAGDKLGILMTSIATAFGAPGIPASSIAFMTPVLQQLHLQPDQMEAVFAMIMLMDRPFDMLQTAFNVTGDMVVAMDTEASAKGGGSAGVIRKIKNRLRGNNPSAHTN